ncbi:MAG TPA: OB-fold domain-containing protein [Candidatus Dormibacteraeota bacterium]|nr:OB-fold domain-containing protein [Candidatus Dormibacteraeota bacterium]
MTHEVLSAPHRLEYAYRRSVGPVVGRFLAGLREGRFEGIRGRDGRVLVPPQEYDPVTSEALEEWAPVGPGGEVRSWAWIPEPLPGQPLARPFAWALVRLDGADTALLHAVDARDEGRMHTGLRVVPRWRDRRVGDIHDLECFVPEETAAAPVGPAVPDEAAEPGPVTRIETPISLDYHYTPGAAASRFLRALAEGRLIGQRCPRCGLVYVPPRGACPTDGVPTEEEVELSDHGAVTTFCVVNVPFAEHTIEMPYVAASILLDGADIAFQHLVQEIPAAEVRIGLRVQAVWKPRAGWGPGLDSIRYFRPEGP